MANSKKITTREVKEGKAAPVVETVVEIYEEAKEEVNETVGTVTFKRWQVALIAAIVCSTIILVFAL